MIERAFSACRSARATVGGSLRGVLVGVRAIVLQPLCETCHGRNLAPEVAAAVAASYPNDRATGFEVGALRGAFIIDWKEDASP